MKIGLRLSQNSHTPVTVQIIEGVARLIRTGRLKPGTVLPSVREAAKDWGVNFTTVSRGYKQLQESGLIELNSSRRLEVRAVHTMTPSDRAALLRPMILGLKAQARELGVQDDELHAEVVRVLKMPYVQG
ncbi:MULTISPECIES: GntR family transcriptional regulator [Xanthomonas]|uniref:GntR family transcriptional regulator n=1 Tax=Xanthomonas TaxID=338 RepID=UPI001C48B1F6|nr:MULTISPECIES: GntR family transcriptional regulator [Xanthomonas]MBV6855889.1 GntR family transcriptional regulator [Xanthomonas campestris pv. mirabilis]MBV6867870.1 GntR family transcriptional regulator [Xanthomonas campestris pv. coriandri]MCE4330790.1 GntR family transcriptional regulator [Xanthomonas campestris pv. coriandri]MEA9776943.1 GntR family transcriptional regulator [Xanthomonas campestris pv. raphani]